MNFAEDNYNDEQFENLDWSQMEVRKKEFEDCTFKNCNFFESSFMHCRFTECRFFNCNLSLIKLTGTTVSSAVFEGCKLTGVSFSDCSEGFFSADFTDCLMDYSGFMKRKMVKTVFRNCSLKSADFGSANLSNSVFDNCNLEHTVFHETNLQGVNFITSYNYSIDPTSNSVKGGQFSLEGLPGLLEIFKIKVK